MCLCLQDARKLLDSLLVIRMKTPADDPDKRNEFVDFSNKIKTMSHDRFNYTYSPTEEVRSAIKLTTKERITVPYCVSHNRTQQIM